MKKDLRKINIILLRRYYRLLDKDYIPRMISKRTGKCKKCGRCCKGCLFLNKKTKLCKIYNRRSGLFCYKEFPLDKNDQKVWDVEKVCGYKFKRGSGK